MTHDLKIFFPVNITSFMSLMHLYVLCSITALLSARNSELMLCICILPRIYQFLMLGPTVRFDSNFNTNL